MKRKIAAMFTSFFIIGVFGLSFNTFAENKVSLVAGQNYYPYYAEDLEGGGFITQIITEAYRRVNYTVEVKFVPWARALYLVEKGGYDGIYSLWYRKEREEWAAFSDPFYLNETMFLKRKEDKISFKTLEDLKPYQIGIIRGYSYPEVFREATYLKKIAATDNPQNFRRLAIKRIDLILIDQMVGNYLMKTLPDVKEEEFEWLEPALQKTPQHIGFSKKVKDYQVKLEAFNKGLKEITADGTLEKIIKQSGFQSP